MHVRTVEEVYACKEHAQALQKALYELLGTCVYDEIDLYTKEHIDKLLKEMEIKNVLPDTITKHNVPLYYAKIWYVKQCNHIKHVAQGIYLISTTGRIYDVNNKDNFYIKTKINKGD